MTTCYQIEARYEYSRSDHKGHVWEGVKHLPFFYLNADVQGIMHEEHAALLAKGIVDVLPTPDHWHGQWFIKAWKVD